MSSTPSSRLDELFADRALGALTPEDEVELKGLLRDHPDRDDLGWEISVAALAVAFAAQQDPEGVEPLPSTLALRLEHELVRQTTSPREPSFPPLPKISSPAPTASARTSAPSSTRPLRLVSGLGWAAAAVLAIALAWPESRPGLPPLPSADEIAAIPGALDWTFTALPGFEEASGRVVWSAKEQRGVLELRGLPVNDPRQSQYQLWIMDAEQAQPIDGGVFDVRGSVQRVAIDSRLPALAVQQFAITVEKPGGVVVSAQESVVASATP